MTSLWVRLATILAAATLCAPSLAQDKKISALPAASALTGPEKLAGVQGAGCAASTAPCANVSVTPAQIATYVAGSAPITSAFQPLDADLTSIAALTTQSYGRSLLTQASSASARTSLGVAIGANVQAWSEQLDVIAALSAANNDILQRKAGVWVNRTPAQVRADLASGYIVHQSAVNSAVTGSTTETTLATFTIPANSLGANGSADILFVAGYTNSANTKTLRIRINGTQVLSLTPTTTASGLILFTIANRGATDSQVANAPGVTGTGATSGAEQAFAFDTTADLTVTITGQLAVTGEEIRLARRRCIVYPGA